MRWYLSLVLIAWCGSTCLRAQGPTGLRTLFPPAAEETALPDQDLDRLQRDLAADLERVRAAWEAADPGNRGRPVLEAEVERLQSLGFVYRQQRAAMEERETLDRAIAERDAQLERINARGLDLAGPYPITALDEVRDRIATESAKAELLSAALEIAVKNSRLAHEAWQQRAEASPDVRGANQDGEMAAWARADLADIEARLREQRLRLCELETENARARLTLHQRTLALERERRRLVADEVYFNEEVLDGQVAVLNERERETRTRLRAAQTELEGRERRWFAANARLEAAGSSASAPLRAEVEALDLEREVAKDEAILCMRHLQRLAAMKEVWQRRFRLVSGKVGGTDLETWRSESGLAPPRHEKELWVARIRDFREQRGRIQREIERLDADRAEVQPWLDGQRQTLRQLIDLYEADLGHADEYLRLLRNYRDELEAAVFSPSLWEQAATVWRTLIKIWNFEIIQLDGNSLTLKKLMLGLVLFLAGIWVSRRMSVMMAIRLFPRLGLTHGAAHTVQTISFYFMVVLFTLFALQLINVPLTIFTFLGGALAIGVGFGSQNLMNNFISGLILLVERPIKVGDLIQVDDLYGKVLRIGGRSTMVRTSRNIDIILPNSSFLEQNVINWTHSDNRVRTSVTVGFSYGSPTDRVKELLLRAAAEHPKVLDNPGSTVLFTEFGDNALGFEILFWISISSQFERQIIESELRFRIDALAREANIVIAFPQRDVHLDTAKPLQIQMMERGQEKP